MTCAAPSWLKVAIMSPKVTVLREFSAAVPTAISASWPLATTERERNSPPALAMTATRFDWDTEAVLFVLPMLIPYTILN